MVAATSDGVGIGADGLRECANCEKNGRQLLFLFASDIRNNVQLVSNVSTSFFTISILVKLTLSLGG